MAKPILIVTLPNFVSTSRVISLKEGLISALNNEYHVLLATFDVKQPEYVCLNDCKGLLDADIEALINKYYENTNSK